MDKKQLISSEVVSTNLNKNPEYRKAKRKLSPYFQIVIEIINRRNELGLSQKELAERVGTHQSRISKIESASSDLRLSTLIDIAEALESELKIQLTPIKETEYSANDTILYSKLFNTDVGVSNDFSTFSVKSELEFKVNG